MRVPGTCKVPAGRNACGRIQLMPINIARLVVALVLALTIPLQGMASVAAGLCMAMGHHDAGMPASHDHGHDADHSAPHDHEPDGSDSPAHCAPCVACCAAASIAPATSLALPEPAPAAALAGLISLHPGFLPETLDRPPLVL